MGPVVAAIVIGALAAYAMAIWGEDHQSLVAAEMDRERGRVWGMTCTAMHRAVQAGMVTAPGAVPPGPITAPARVTVAQLKQPPLPVPPAPPFTPFLPAGLREADQAGLVEARYGAVMADGIPLAVCSLTGSGVEARFPDLRKGAVMGGLDNIGFVGGDATPMHGRLADVVAVLGGLPEGSMFATADFGIGHAVERVYRRPVGGRPELSSMEQEIRFEAGTNILRAGTVAGESASADRGSVAVAGTVDAAGDVLIRPAGSLAIQAATTVEADRNFAFGGGSQTSWRIPGEFAVGRSLRSRGEVGAQTVALTADMEIGGELSAIATVRAASGTVDAGAEAIAAGAQVGSLVVNSCSGCQPPNLGP